MLPSDPLLISLWLRPPLPHVSTVSFWNILDLDGHVTTEVFRESALLRLNISEQTKKRSFGLIAESYHRVSAPLISLGWWGRTKHQLPKNSLPPKNCFKREKEIRDKAEVKGQRQGNKRGCSELENLWPAPTLLDFLLHKSVWSSFPKENSLLNKTSWNQITSIQCLLFFKYFFIFMKETFSDVHQ